MRILSIFFVLTTVACGGTTKNNGSSGSTSGGGGACTSTFTGPYAYSGNCGVTAVDSQSSGVLPDAGSAFALQVSDSSGNTVQLYVGFTGNMPATGTITESTNPGELMAILSGSGSSVGDSAPSLGKRKVNLQISSVDQPIQGVYTLHGSLDTTFDAISGAGYDDGGFPVASEHVTATF